MVIARPGWQGSCDRATTMDPSKRVRPSATGLVRSNRFLSCPCGGFCRRGMLHMSRSEFSSFGAVGIALALILSAPSDPRQGDDATEAATTEIVSPAEDARGEAGTFEMTSPPDPILPDDGTQKDEGPFNPD